MMMQQRNDLGEQSERRIGQRFWREVWICNLPGRVKTMVWRLFHDALPDAHNLRSRGCLGVGDGKCLGCGFHMESALHIVRDCWRMMALWRKIGIDERSLEWQGGSAADWLVECARMGGRANFRKIMGGSWLLWNCRNMLLHNEKEWTIDDMTMKLDTMFYQGDQFIGRNCEMRVPCALFMPEDKSKDCIL